MSVGEVSLETKPEEIAEEIARAVAPAIEAAVSVATETIASAIEEHEEHHEPRRERCQLLTPQGIRLPESLQVDAHVSVYHGRQFCCVCTPWGWIYQRDDGRLFDVLSEAIKSVKPVPPSPADHGVPPTE